MDKPTVGRIVHYFERDARDTNMKIIPIAAIITEVLEGHENNPVILTLFIPGAVRCVNKPVYQGTGKGCWNWPKKEVSLIVNT